MVKAFPHDLRRLKQEIVPSTLRRRLPTVVLRAQPEARVGSHSRSVQSPPHALEERGAPGCATVSFAFARPTRQVRGPGERHATVCRAAGSRGSPNQEK
jgi:hypothetical protein